MSSRSSRPRNGPPKDDGAEHEEQQMWNLIKDSLKRLATNQKRQIEISKQIEELEKNAAERAKTDDGGATVQEIEAIQKLYREQLKLAADEKRALSEEPHDILKNLEILSALRKASSEDKSLSAAAPPPRTLSKVRKVKPLGKSSAAAAAAAASSSSSTTTGGTGSAAAGSSGGAAGSSSSGAGGSGGGTGGSGGASSASGGVTTSGGSGGPSGGRDRSGGTKNEDDDASSTGGGSTTVGGQDGASDTAGPPAGVARVKGSSVRSGSVSRRDATVDRELEDSGRGAGAERAGKLVKGAEVAYKQAEPREDGSQWIVCMITAVVVEKGGGSTSGSGDNTATGGQRRYEVQDIDSEEKSGEAEKYLAAAKDLIAISGPKESLPDYPVGKQVLARYPDTTTFYNAEVLGNRKEKGGIVCRLRFEEDDHEREVLRRYVLDVAGK